MHDRLPASRNPDPTDGDSVDHVALVRRAGVRVRRPDVGSALVLALLVGVSLILRPTPEPSNDADPAGGALDRAANPSIVGAVASPGSIPPTVLGRGWFAQVGSDEWTAGSVGGPTVALPRGEVGVAAADGWALSAFRDDAGNNLVWRKIGDPATNILPISFVPADAAVFGDRAYLSGFDQATGGDPGIFSLDLTSGYFVQLLPSGGAAAPRTVDVSRTGLTLASAICGDLNAGCDLDIVNTVDGTARHLSNVPGYLRATGDVIAIVGPDPASWVAGIDVETGAELWRRHSDEMWLGYVTSTGRLIQASLEYSESGSVFSVDSIDLATGATIEILTEAATDPVGLWPEVSSDDTVVIGPGFSIEDALVNAQGNAVTADMYSVFTGARISTQLLVGGK